GDRVDQEAVGRMDRLVTVAQIGVGDEVEQVIGAGSAHDAVGIEPEGVSDGLAEGRRRAVRIVLQMVGDGAIGGDRLWTRAQRGLVRGQLEYARDAGGGASARHVRVDSEHAGSRLWAVGIHRMLSHEWSPATL